jgi:hypothetical protein
MEKRMKNKQTDLLNPEIETRIEALLAQMTMLEKVGQLTQLGASIVGGFDLGAFHLS